MAVERRATQTKKWSAWAGDRDELQRLVTRMDQLVEPRRQEAMQRAREQRSSPIYDDEDKAEAVADARRKWTTHLEAVESKLSLRHSGPAHEVIEQLPPGGLKRLTFQVPSGYVPGPRTSVEVVLSDRGCELTAEGEDPEWVQGRFATLQSEWERGVPWWAPIRSPNALSVFVALATGAVGVALSRDFEDIGIVDLAGASFVGGAVIGSGLYAFIRWLLPAFEVLRPARSGRTIRLAAAIGVILSVGLGLVSLVTS